MYVGKKQQLNIKSTNENFDELWRKVNDRRCIVYHPLHRQLLRLSTVVIGGTKKKLGMSSELTS